MSKLRFEDDPEMMELIEDQSQIEDLFEQGVSDQDLQSRREAVFAKAVKLFRQRGNTPDAYIAMAKDEARRIKQEAKHLKPGDFDV